ncbi:hypothetical protein PRN20_16965 [Devosia sp. ZB163]|uniref:DUF883 family protein n=1 Tax=Devosia sp. ZB163 TaxID=3025938 RepID=UPI00235F79EE|nr:hypothetical protein [Devosia sp. ZB163]MDC9825424.1 hypothetical protein [Devosia sp. ZB163]
MASTTDMAPNRSSSTPARRASNGPRRAAPRRAASAKTSEDDLAAQVNQLQDDLKQIAATLASMAGGKVNDAQAMAKRESRHLAQTGQRAIQDAQDEFGQLEKQIKDTIREKPLTAVAGAIALGFVLAVVSR